MKEFIDSILDSAPVGSRITCEPPPVGTDRDWLVLVQPELWNNFIEELFSFGWILGGSSIPNEINETPSDQRFNSFTLGEDNIIATCSPEFYQRFMAATSIAKKFNLREKDARIALFQAVLYGNEVIA